MNLNHHLHDYFFTSEPYLAEDVYDEDAYGVGAVMPQDMPEFTFLTEAELYGA
jgi:hypothetical protein